MIMSLSRLATPRVGFQLHSRQLLERSQCVLRKSYSTSRAPPPKPRVLEQPDKFRPPSHPARLRPKPRYAGPPLSEHERQAQSTRQYPHMMPPEGTFMHWFLTSRSLHMYITLTILLTLVFGTYFQSFLRATPYRDMLPPNSMFFAHPFQFLHRWWTVYSMHVDFVSAETREKRKAKSDDVIKRAEYRKAHGIEEKEKDVLGGWSLRDDIGGSMQVPKELLKNPPPDDASPKAHDAERKEKAQAGASGETYVAFDGTIQPTRKKWLGIF